MANRALLNIVDGPEAGARNEAFAKHDWDDDDIDFPYNSGNMKYQMQLMAFDTTMKMGLFEEWLDRETIPHLHPRKYANQHENEKFNGSIGAMSIEETIFNLRLKIEGTW